MERKVFARLLSCLALVTGLALAGPLYAADGLTVLHAFNTTDGLSPAGRLVQGPDGAFYGTTTYGGLNDFGEVFRVDASGDFSILYSFPKTGGVNPQGALVLMDDGFFYGTTPNLNYCRDTPRGPFCKTLGSGTVFRVGADGSFATVHVFKNLRTHQFIDPLTDGGDGLLYGMTAVGGPETYGFAYAISTDGIYVPLADFHQATGGRPYGGLTRGTDGNFYGTASDGGAHGYGTVFRMSPDGTMTTLYSFTGGADGRWPRTTLLQGSDGRLYGGAGTTVFAITTGGELTVLHTFDNPDTPGVIEKLVEGADGYLYGTSIDSDYPLGGLYRMSKDGRLFEVLHQFTAQEGTQPSSGLIFGGDGRLYGTTWTSGNGFGGTVYAFDLTALRKAKP